jgi:hypothetical protein
MDIPAATQARLEDWGMLKAPLVATDYAPTVL